MQSNDKRISAALIRVIGKSRLPKQQQKSQEQQRTNKAAFVHDLNHNLSDERNKIFVFPY